MAAQHLSAWSPAAKGSAHTALLEFLDAGASSASLTIHDASDKLLVTVALTEPCGTVNGTTGALTLTPAGTGTGVDEGVPSYASLRDGSGTVHRSLPCEQGMSPVVNKCVLNVMSISVGTVVTVVSFGVS